VARVFDHSHDRVAVAAHHGCNSRGMVGLSRRAGRRDRAHGAVRRGMGRGVSAVRTGHCPGGHGAGFRHHHLADRGGRLHRAAGGAAPGPAGHATRSAAVCGAGRSSDRRGSLLTRGRNERGRRRTPSHGAGRLRARAGDLRRLRHRLAHDELQLRVRRADCGGNPAARERSGSGQLCRVCHCRLGGLPHQRGLLPLPSGAEPELEFRRGGPRVEQHSAGHCDGRPVAVRLSTFTVRARPGWAATVRSWAGPPS
jgi:hypothetical protein